MGSILPLKRNCKTINNTLLMASIITVCDAGKEDFNSRNWKATENLHHILVVYSPTT